MNKIEHLVSHAYKLGTYFLSKYDLSNPLPCIFVCVILILYARHEYVFGILTNFVSAQSMRQF